MPWHVLQKSDESQLDALAARYRLHPLHIEDCRHGNQSAKLEDGQGYTFLVLKPTRVDPDNGEVELGDLDIFIGPGFLITYEETECPPVREMISRVYAQAGDASMDQLVYRIFDHIVDSYLPVLDHYGEQIDRLEDEVIERPEPELLQRIFTIKRALILLRRVLAQTRDVSSHIQRIGCPGVAPEMAPYFRDVYDHLARNIDSVEMLRDLLTGSLDIYLSSVANRTNQVMKVLTVLSTVALPALIVSGFYGMNFDKLPLLKDPNGFWYATGGVALSTVAMLIGLRWVRWI